MTENIAYATPEIARYFAHNRVHWAQFYESERVIIDKLGLDQTDAVLDIGCGCGGLGMALRERFGVENYCGVEINSAAAAAGRELNPKARIMSGDIIEISRDELGDAEFDVVFSLSCVDWNIAFEEMLAVAWKHVRPGGQLVATFRLTDGEGCSEFSKSHQFINYDGQKEGELAAYVVLNAGDLLRRLLAYDPAEINAYGYWGPPSSTAETPYERLCFAGFSVRRRVAESGPPKVKLDLPLDLLAEIRHPQS
jgi:SAM-dependent methyltransferase